MKIALASDHTGFEQLVELSDYLELLGHTVHNFGPESLNPDDDYPDFIIPAARSIANGEYEVGIVLGGDGQGEAMAANKIKGIRCAVIYGPAMPQRVVDINGRVSHNPYEVVRLTRLHNDSNMLSLATRFMAFNDVKNIIKLWLETPFSQEERHQRRIDKFKQFGS